MTSWGVDLGTRSAYAARLDRGHITHFQLSTLKFRKNPRGTELWLLFQWADQLPIQPEDLVLIEEPPLAGSRNIRTFLGLAQASGVLAAATQGELVEVDTWKRGTVGRGGVSKALVAEWLSIRHPDYYAACGGDQNLVDATCIALLGERRQAGQ